jgi:hypothetical protein
MVTATAPSFWWERSSIFVTILLVPPYFSLPTYHLVSESQGKEMAEQINSDKYIECSARKSSRSIPGDHPSGYQPPK